jgi:hypothetical protein
MALMDVSFFQPVMQRIMIESVGFALKGGKPVSHLSGG